MWLFADDKTALINTDNAESIEVSEKSIYINMVSGKAHLYGQCVDEEETVDMLRALRTMLNL